MKISVIVSDWKVTAVQNDNSQNLQCVLRAKEKDSSYFVSENNQHTFNLTFNFEIYSFRFARTTAP